MGINMTFVLKSAIIEMKSVEFNGRTHTLNFCIDCQIYRPIRSYHCNNCGTCIEEMGNDLLRDFSIICIDHHCSWMGTCIGRRNRLKFCYFLVMGLFYCVQTFELFFKSPLYDNDENTNSVKNLLNLVFVVEIFILGAFLLALFSIQLLLISKGLTTVEFLRSYIRTGVRPFDQGFFKNWKEFLTCNRSSRILNFDMIRKLQSINRLEFDETMDTSLNISLVENVQ